MYAIKAIESYSCPNLTTSIIAINAQDWPLMKILIIGLEYGKGIISVIHPDPNLSYKQPFSNRVYLAYGCKLPQIYNAYNI